MIINKLYRVNLTNAPSVFAIARDPTEAYNKARDYYDLKDYGYERDRALKSIELLAEETEDPECGTILFV